MTKRRTRRSLLALTIPLASAGIPALASVTEFAIPTPNSFPDGITRGPDGNLWFAENHAIGRITPAGQVTEFTQGLSPASAPQEITAGPDGNLWFTAGGSDRIGRITPAGAVTEFPTPSPVGNSVFGITPGPDGNLWFTEQAGRIGRITTGGVVTEFAAGITPNSQPTGITAGPDGNLWFTERSGARIGRITPAGTVTEFSAGISHSSDPFGITRGADGNLWFTETSGRIGRITPAGQVTEFSAGITLASVPADITPGPDGSLWFTEQAGRIGRITTGGVVTEFSMGITPGTEPLGITAGSDANIWFAEFAGNKIGRFDLQAGAANAQWSFDANGTWSNPANWTGGVPNAVDAIASFAGVITAPRVVTVDSPQTLAQISFNSTHTYTIAGPRTITLSASSGQALVSPSHGNHTISAPLTLVADTLFIVGAIEDNQTLTISGPLTAGGRTITTSGAGTVQFSNVRAAALKINDGTTRILPNGTAAGAGRLGSLTVAFNSELDLTDNDLQITGGNTYQQVATLIFQGLHGGGAPSGLPALLSSTALSDPSHRTALGTLTGAQYKSTHGRTTFDGFSVNDSDVLVMYTYGGDANLDGKINVDDYGRLDFNVNLGTSGWFNGDFNYDGKINVDDYGIIDFNIGIQGPPFAAGADASDNLTAVPEPGGALIILAGGAALVRRRRTKGLFTSLEGCP